MNNYIAASTILPEPESTVVVEEGQGLVLFSALIEYHPSTQQEQENIKRLLLSIKIELPALILYLYPDITKLAITAVTLYKPRTTEEADNAQLLLFILKRQLEDD